MFNRLMERFEDIKSYFSYELIPIPTSLSKNNLM